MKNLWLNPSFAASKAPISVVADRDGTLIEHVDYVHDPDQIQLLSGVKTCVHELIQANIPLFIFTNQSGVGRGFCTIEAVHACQNAYLNCSKLNLIQSRAGALRPRPQEQAEAFANPHLASSMKPHNM